MKKFIYLIGLYFLGLSCNEKPKNYLEKLSTNIVTIGNPDEWKVIQELPHGQVILEKIDYETLKTLNISIVKEEVYIVRYDKIFPCFKTDTCFVSFDEKDTLFYYSSRGANNFF